MPCNTVTTNTVKLENVRNHDLLESALKAQFVNVYRAGDRFVFSHGRTQVVIEGGRATSSLGSAELGAVVGLVKQAYARKAVELAARRFGWATVKGADVNHFQLRKG
jgi:hypothetical protein